jgi:hypothetical protein
MNCLESALASIPDDNTALRCAAPWLPDESWRPPPLVGGPGPGDDDDDDEDDDKGNIEPDDDEGYDDEDDEDDDEEPLRCDRRAHAREHRRVGGPSASLRRSIP